MKKYFKMLRECSLFHGIEDERLLELLDCLGARIQEYKKGQIILAEGDPAICFGIVLSGEAQVTRVDYFGNRTIVTNLEPSELFGESFACAGLKALPVDVVGIKAGEVLLIDAQRIMRSCGNACGFHNQMIFNLMKVIAGKNLIFHQKLEITSKRSTREKLMAYLLLEAKKNGSDTFAIPYDRQELADYLEVDRSGLSAEISKMRREGILESNKNQFHLYQQSSL